MKKTVSVGTFSARVFLSSTEQKVPDEQIQERLMELISSMDLLMDTGS
ncbi:hypothetical protein P7H17_05375 [Paenibacillus larvae]|nr:hypothetical protein [Paenibacillus larvae]MDT2285640.1 hypothetical protein [Paenibacillus larvae]